MTKKSPLYSFDFTEKTHERLEYFSKKWNRSKRSIIEEALEMYFKREEKKLAEKI